MNLVLIALAIWSALMSTVIAIVVLVQAVKRRRKPLIDVDWLRSLGLPKIAPWQREVFRSFARQGVSPTGRRGHSAEPITMDETYEFDHYQMSKSREPKHANTDTEVTLTIPRMPGTHPLIKDQQIGRTLRPAGMDPLTHAVRSGVDVTNIMPSAGELAATVRAEYERQPATPPRGLTIRSGSFWPDQAATEAELTEVSGQLADGTRYRGLADMVNPTAADPDPYDVAEDEHGDFS